LVDDLTERKHLEEQLRQSQRMDALGQLAGGVAHDFNNLLTAINGYAELVADSLPQGAAQRQDVEEIARAGARAAALTQQLLAFGRRQVLAPAVLCLGDIVNDLIPLLRRLIGEMIDLKAHTADTGSVKADRGQIEQVLVNLVVNARDAMPNGGFLTISTGDLLLDEDDVRHFPAFEPGRYVLLEVVDTGCGMDRETRSRIFEPFFTTKPKGQGTGLGLSMAYGIVRQSGGFIDVDSEPGYGSTFRILLPRVDEAVERPQGGIARRPRNGAEAILLVEDEELVRDFTERVLRRHGYTVYAQPHPVKALEFLREAQVQIDLLVTDVVMPGMSGKELATEAVVWHPEARVLYMSGYPGDAIVKHGVLDRGTWFIQKPFSADALADKVREVLDAPFPL
jgi:nitrogen-specific signal transduction histidine kinase/CheY-like chemotaxis protein